MIIRLDNGWTMVVEVPTVLQVRSPGVSGEVFTCKSVESITCGARDGVVKATSLDGEEVTIDLECCHVECEEANGLVVCAQCNFVFGPVCDKSPDRMCHYSHELRGSQVLLATGNMAAVKIVGEGDECLFCGKQPEEVI